MPPKRKLETPAVAKTESQYSKDSKRPQKKPRKDLKEHGKNLEREKRTEDETVADPQIASILQEDERSFPRGGGSALTPLEHKQIQIQATKDALFEERSEKRQRDDNVEGLEVHNAAGGIGKSTSKKRKQSKRVKAADPHGITAEPHIRVEGLKFKRLTPGSMVLGQVTKITTNEIHLDLPNNLSGKVSITDISSPLNERLEVAEKAEESTNATDEIDLDDLFYVGQYLRACVLSTNQTGLGENEKSRRRLELTLNPSITNSGMDPSEVKTYCMLQAAVSSIEDHGIIMDLGFSGNPDKMVKGFMSSKEIPDGRSYADMQKGAVFMCLVTGVSSNGRVIKLSANQQKAGDLRQSNVLVDSQTVHALLPGTAVELLISQLSSTTIAGKLMGLVDASADIIHCGAASKKADIESNHKIGNKIKARVLFKFTEVEKQVLGLSILEHILSLSPRLLQEGKAKQNPLEARPVGTQIEKAKIVNVEPGLGIFANIGTRDIPAFIHLSRLADEKVDMPSQTTGPFRSGTLHHARVIGYNTIDGLYLASFEKSVIDQTYLRIEDVPVGEVVHGTVEKLIFNAKGGCGLLVNIAKGITGLVPELHLADIHLQHPERKFREGQKVTTKVLSTDTERNQIRLTLKKSLVQSEASPWTEYSKVVQGSESTGTIIMLDGKGALVQFYGDVRGFLPVAEMSDTFVEDPLMRFKMGQVITVRAISVTPAAQRMTLSCRSAPSESSVTRSGISGLTVGDLVSGIVLQISEEIIDVQLKGVEAKANLPITHLTDGSAHRNENAAKNIRPGQSLNDLVIIEIFNKRQAITLSNKSSLVKEARAGKTDMSLVELEEGETLHGFVRNITEREGIFLQSLGGQISLIPKSHIPSDRRQLPDFGYVKDQSLSARILSIDLNESRLTCTLRQPEEQQKKAKPAATVEKLQPSAEQTLANPVDSRSTSVADFSIGNTTVARITSIKDTQLNVLLADNVHGRIDVSEVFANIEDINDRKHPLKGFKVKSTLPVRVLGIHDARNHRFLPISHRGGKIPVFELSAKVDVNDSVRTLNELEIGSWHLAFVNNITDSALWVNLSPNVRGRIERVEVSEDVSVLSNLEEYFPIGSAIAVRVLNVDVDTAHLDLSAKKPSSKPVVTLENLTEGSILTGRVTKVTERSILVELGPGVVGQVGLTEMTDDFNLADPTEYKKNDIIKVCVLDIDRANKRVALSQRPSKVLSSTLPVKDRQILSVDQIKANDTVRGFIKNVADVGVFVTIGFNVTAFVRVSELSDSFVKDWKSNFEIDRLVTGKVISVDMATKQVQLSFKDSVVSTDYVPKLTYNDVEVGMVVTGKIRKVEEYGAFIVIDNSNNVSGLAHRSEIAERRIQDVRKVYDEGDVVKAKVLTVDKTKGKISLGLKASYFKNSGESSDDDDEEYNNGGVDLDIEDGEDEDMFSDEEKEYGNHNGGVELEGEDSGEEEESDEDDLDRSVGFNEEVDGLDAGGFDWTGNIHKNDTSKISRVTKTPGQSDSSQGLPNRQLRKGPQPDLTGHLTDFDPQTTHDFERLLLSARNDSALWLRYVAFHAGQGALNDARTIAERAIKEIDIKFQDERLNIWLGFLNLEVNYGTSTTTDEIFTRACEYNDAKIIHERLASIYIQAGKREEADGVYSAMTKKKDWNKAPGLWTTYATFLFDEISSPDRARELLARADQVLVNKQDPAELQTKIRRDLISRFAELEFRCKNGDPERGRGQYEGLVSAYPKRWDIWDRYVEMELRHGEKENVRSLFDRMTRLPQKSRRATYAFKKWLEFEEAVDIEEVDMKAREMKRKRVELVKSRALEVAEKLRMQKDS